MIGAPQQANAKRTTAPIGIERRGGADNHMTVCFTLTTLDRGSRSIWVFKTKPSGQVATARRSATVFCGHRNAAFSLEAEKMLSRRLYRFCWIPHVGSRTF